MRGTENMLGWPAQDLVTIAGAALVLLLPGLAVLAVSGWATRSRLAVALGAAPVVTAGLAYVTAALTAAAGIRYGLVTFLVTNLLVVAGTFAVARFRGKPDGPVNPTGITAFGPEDPSRQALVVGAAGALLAIAITVQTWGTGLGSLAVVPQEHDTVTHTLLAARIARTGEAAPWDAWPADLLTGEPDNFYPVGFHSLAALLTTFGPDAVTALNAMSVAVFAVAMPLGMLALGSLLRWRGLGAVAGGAGAVAGALAYRPVYAMMHDGGILTNAVGTALTAGAVALLLCLGRWVRQELVPAVLVMVGVVAVYPSTAVAVLLGVVLWAAGGLLSRRVGRLQFRSWAVSLTAAGLIALVLALPTLLSGGSSGEFVATFSRDTPVWPFWQGLGIALGMPYGGYLDPAWEKSQVLLAVLSLAGAGACLVLRRHAGLTLAWAGTATVLLSFAAALGGPVLAAVTGIFYNSYVRISSLVSTYQWLLAGVAVVAVSLLITRAVSRVAAGRTRMPTLERITHGVALALVLAMAVATADYRQINALSLQARYRFPDFTRVDADDRAAIRYLEGEVGPGERVMNNANDGSTYLYVYAGVPVVNVQTLGGSEETKKLLAEFDEIDTNAGIRELVQELNIRWVYADEEAPPIGAPASEDWLDDTVYSVAPGFADLEDAKSLHPVFEEGSVTVYRVDESVLVED
ncbi:DUF6541 family protein [Georgenia sp. AZ-5]|uniref:DUF6541 family protein n=1 Tax=Georgenia sp. AZ-5 TaxID=3367526 RepID=UPI003754B214